MTLLLKYQTPILSGIQVSGIKVSGIQIVTVFLPLVHLFLFASQCVGKYTMMIMIAYQQKRELIKTKQEKEFASAYVMVMMIAKLFLYLHAL